MVGTAYSKIQIVSCAGTKIIIINGITTLVTKYSEIHMKYEGLGHFHPNL